MPDYMTALAILLAATGHYRLPLTASQVSLSTTGISTIIAAVSGPADWPILPDTRMRAVFALRTNYQ